MADASRRWRLPTRWKRRLPTLDGGRRGGGRHTPEKAGLQAGAPAEELAKGERVDATWGMAAAHRRGGFFLDPL
jgi:hypothetical protein